MKRFAHYWRRLKYVGGKGMSIDTCLPEYHRIGKTSAALVGTRRAWPKNELPGNLEA